MPFKVTDGFPNWAIFEGPTAADATLSAIIGWDVFPILKDVTEAKTNPYSYFLAIDRRIHQTTGGGGGGGGGGANTTGKGQVFPTNLGV